MLPAQQGFGPHRQAAGRVELGLVVQAKLLLFDGIAQVLQQLQLLARIGVHRHIEKAVAVLAYALGVVHRSVGVHQQFLGRAAVARKHGDANAGGDFQLMLGHLERPIDQHDLAFGKAKGVIRLRQLHQQYKLVATDAGQGVVAAQVFAQTLADFTQQLVAHMVTEGVVDRFEAVQVDEHQREATALLLHRLDRVFNTVGEQGAIGQAGERVVQGQVGQFLVGLGKRIGEHGGTRFQARIEQRGQQRDGQHGQGRHQHQIIQALAAQAVEGRTAEAVIGKACRRHAGVMHADNGHAHHHRCTAPHEAHVRGVAPQVEGNPQGRTGSHHRDQQRAAKPGGVVVDARCHAHRGHAGVVHAGDAGAHDQRTADQLPGGQPGLVDQP